MSPQSLFLVYLVFVSLVAFALLIFLLRAWLRRRNLLMRSLNLDLLSVRFPQVQTEQQMSVAQSREKIALMEQLYANMHMVRDKWWRAALYGRPSFALELSVPRVGEELSFFLAVPRRLSPAVEKVIQGIFPDAQAERARDYNIFNPDGKSVGSFLLLKANRFYPIRTYQKLEGDSMKAIAGVFTKLAQVGEGAALQIVARPARGKWKSRLRSRAKVFFSGKKPADDALSKAAGAFGAPHAPAVSGQAPATPVPMVRLTPLEEETVRALENKAGKPLFEANIRLLASASDEARALAILSGLELAFSQFTDPSLNGFRARRSKPWSWKKLVFNFSFRAFDPRRKIILSSEEMTSIFHFPNVALETPKMKIVKARDAPAPANLPQEGLLLGYNEFRGEKTEIRMQDDDRRRHLYVIGQTGTGKTVFLENMAVQDISAGRGVCFIDPHGDTADRILGMVPRHRAQDVIYFNPGDMERPMGLNMLEYDPAFPEQKTFIVNELLGIFNKLYNMSIAGGPIFEQYFRNAAMLVMDDPASGNTILEISRVLADKQFRDRKLSQSANVVVKNFWTQIAEKAGGEASLKDMVPYITSKTDNFTTNEIMRPIVAQEKSAFNFREVLDNQKILLINLSKGRLGDLNSSFIGLIVVGKLLMAALSRADTGEEKRKDFYLYIDEFQNVTTDSIATILSEARKYRLNLTIAHQFVGQLKDEIKKAVFGNVGSMAAFRVGSDDAEFIAKQFKPVFSEADLLNIDNRNCYLKLLLNGATAPPFSLKTYPPQKGDLAGAEVIKEISRAKYGRPRADVEAEIMARHEKPLL
ncbi:MAG: type IV secretory system conjugative DNA transfer family protein [Patescibacteria group bacterium]